jgi:hypothetical protein
MNPLADIKLDIVTFIAGGHRIGVEAQAIRCRVGEDHPGAVLVEDLLGLEVDPFSDLGFKQVLLFKRGEGDLAVLVSEPVQLHKVPGDAIFPLPPLLAGCIRMKGVQAFAAIDHAPVPLLDPIQWQPLEPSVTNR